MRKHSDLFYWENQHRLKKLKEFREITIGFFNADNSSEGYYNKRSELNLKTEEAHGYIKAAGVRSVIVLTPPPLIGGYPIRIDLFQDIHNLHRAIRPIQVIDTIEKAIGVYLSNVSSSILRTINPFFYMYRLIDTVTTIPIRLFRVLGFSEDVLDCSYIVRIYKFITQTIIWVSALLTLLHRFGLLNSFLSLIGQK